MTDVVTLGRRLRHARRAQGLTLAQLAAQVGVAPSALSLLENGRREPRLGLLQSLAAALDTMATTFRRPVTGTGKLGSHWPG